MPELPVGTVTFLLTDVEGSSRLWEENPSEMKGAITRHHEVIRESIERFGGARPADQGEGDSVVAAFARATEAATCALNMQLALVKERWPGGIDLKVRVALHTGEAELRDEQNYAAHTLNRAARLRAIAHGGQVLISQSTWDLVRERPPEGAGFRDLGSHRLKDLTQPEHVFQLTHPELPREFPPLKSLDGLPNNLPLQLTGLVGREREIIQVKKLLAESRLVTLTGAAGCGKTRLALQVGAEMLDEYPDGVWFVDLAPVADPSGVARTAASVLGITEPPGRSILEFMTEHMKSRELLLVLDNCEHLLSASTEVAATLLRSCPSVRVLATSREPLGIPGEIPWRVPSLPFPDPLHAPDPETLRNFDATHLFIDRALAAAPDLEVSAESAVAVTQICHRLDGMPLAIELAAARAEVLSFEQIAKMLDDQFRLLTGGSRTALERQQTIRAAVEWSYELLTDDERTLLRRLSVFAGGFSLEAAEEVCGSDPLEASAVLDLLSALVRKSLVTVTRRGHAARYRLLETIRQYAREKLRESGESEPARERHRDWFSDLAGRAEEELLGPNQVEWAETIEAERDNIRAALEWSSASADSENLLRISVPLWRYWVLREPTEGIRWLQEGLSGDQVSEGTRARALGVISYIHSIFGNPKDAQKFAEEGVALSRKVGDDKTTARSLNVLGSVLGRGGDREGSRRAQEESLAILRALGDKRGAAALLGNLGSAAAERGDIDLGLMMTEEAVSLFREVGDKMNLGLGSQAMGNLMMNRDEFSRARSYFEETFSLFRELGTPGASVPAHNLSLLNALLGRLEDASTWGRESVSQVAERQEELSRLLAALGRGWLAYLDGDYRAAVPDFEAVVAQGRSLGQMEYVGWARMFGGFAAEGDGELEVARAQFEESLETLRAHHQILDIWEPLAGLARATGALGDLEAAAEASREAIQISARIGSKLGFTNGLDPLAAVSARRGDATRAARLFGAAAALRDSVGAAGWPHLIRWREGEISSARQALGETDFEKAWAEGRGMSFEEAVSFAEE